jgi:ribosomal protein S27E
MPEQKCQDLLHLFRLIGKPAVQAVVNYISFCHTCLHKIQRQTNVPTIRQSEQYKRHRPETTMLYQLVERYYPGFTVNLAEQGKYLPKYVEREFDEFLRCGRLEYGFLRVVCGDCKHEKLVGFSCKRRGFCPSCGARRMAEGAALLVDDVLSSP